MTISNRTTLDNVSRTGILIPIGDFIALNQHEIVVYSCGWAGMRGFKQLSKADKV